jgi:elongation factor Tu
LAQSSRDHGKTTLTAAITKFWHNKVWLIYSIMIKLIRRRRKALVLLLTQSHVEYETKNRHYAHVDCPGHADYVKNMITGAAQMDGAILVVSAPDGPSHKPVNKFCWPVKLVFQPIAVFLNKVDMVDDPSMIDLVEEEFVIY